MNVDFLAARHRVTIPRRIRLRGLLQQCEFIAENSQIIVDCEAYWLFVSLVTWMKAPRMCPIFQRLSEISSDALDLSLLFDFDETTLLTETFEHRFDLIEQLFNVLVARPTLVAGSKVDNLGIYSQIAQTLGLPVEAVIFLHTLEWDQRMSFRPGVLEYIRQEKQLGRIQIVSSSYPDVLAARLYSQGHEVKWDSQLEFPYWVLPEGDVRIVGRFGNADWAKPNPAIPNRAIGLSNLPVDRQVSFEDSMSGVNGST